MSGQLYRRCGHPATKFIKADSYEKNLLYKEDKSSARMSGRAFSFGKQGGLQWAEQAEEAVVAVEENLRQDLTETERRLLEIYNDRVADLHAVAVARAFEKGVIFATQYMKAVLGE